MTFDILTTLSVFADDRNEDDENYGARLSVEQDSVLESLGIHNDFTTEYTISFGNGCTLQLTIDDAIQYLALKDGADLVRFDNSNIGFVGYYNGYDISTNRFEILA